MMNWLKKHWRVVFIIDLIFMSVLPIVINACYLVETNCTILHKPSPWTTFWATYIAAAASLGMIIITMVSIQNNFVENKKNRELQLNILLYQQEQTWLNQFRKAAAEYVALYSYNDLVDVANIAREEAPYKAFYLVKELFSRAGKADLNLAFIQKESDLFKKLNKDKTTLFVFYNQVLDDLQILLTIRISNPEISLKKGRNTVKGLSDDMQNIIDQIIEECPQDNIKNQFNTAIMTRIKLIETCEEKLRAQFNEYINLEQTRINNILQS